MTDTGFTWLTPEHAAASLRISVRTLYRQIAAGTYATRKDGRKTLVNVPVPIEPVTDNELSTKLTFGSQLAEMQLAPLITSMQIDATRARAGRRQGWTIAVITLIGIGFAAGIIWQQDVTIRAMNEHAAQVERLAARTKAEAPTPPEPSPVQIALAKMIDRAFSQD